MHDSNDVGSWMVFIHRERPPLECNTLAALTKAAISRLVLFLSYALSIC